MTFLHSRFLRNAVRPLMGALVSLALLPSASAQTAARRLAAVPAASAARVALPNSVSGRAATAQVTGHLPGETKMQGMKLYLKPTAAQTAALTQLLADQQNPGSASYHKWLTPQQYGAQFGVGDADLAVLQSWLQARGFSVDEVAPSRNFITFSGTGSAVENAFGVTLQQYRRNNREYFENAGNISVPVALADVVGGVTGLSSYHPPAPQTKHAKPQKTASPNYSSGTPGTNYLVPGDIQIIYDMQTLINSGNNGAGITIGVIGQSAVDTNQLTLFQGNTDQTPTKLPTMTLVPNTGTSNMVQDDEGESELDLEYASGTAQGATINFIYTGCTATLPPGSNVLPAGTNCNNSGVFDALTYGVTHSLAPIFTLSYGECEPPSVTSSDITTLEPVLQQANAQGETVLVASGDNGAATCDQGSGSDIATQGLSVSYPASSQYVTAVGGTQLSATSSNWNTTNTANGSSALGYIAETSWNDTAANNTPDPGAGNESPAASGGGVSKIFPKPTWQAGTGVPSDGHRDVPDVALPASDFVNGYLVCSADSPCTAGQGFAGGFVFGGTSVATPNMAAMLAIIEQANHNTTGLGNINPILYTLAQGSSYSSIFHDITTGNNLVNCATNSTGCTAATAQTACPLTVTTYCYGYSAGVGYDQVTGLGSLDANALKGALGNVSSSTPSLALSLSSNTPVPAASVTFTLKVTGINGTSAGSSTTATGTVQFAVDGANVGSPVTLSSGVATYVYSTGFSSNGTHSVTAAYTGGNYNSGSATVTVTAVQSTPTIAVTSTPGTPVQNGPVTLTATMGGTQGTPSGTVTFRVDSVALGAAVTLNNGVATLVYSFATPGNHTVSAVYNGNASYVSVVSPTIIAGVATTTATLTPTVTVSTSPTSPSTTTAATLTATIAGPNGQPTPTGSVYFTVLAPGASSPTIVGSQPMSGGVASLTNYTFTAAGTYTVTADYSGDAVYKPVSQTSTVTVTTPTFTLAVTPASLTISNGNTGTITLTGTSMNGFSGTVTPGQYNVTTLTGVTFAGCLAFTSSTSTSLTVPAGGTGSMTLSVVTNSGNCTAAANRIAPMKVAGNTVLSRWGGTGFGLVSAAGLLGCFFMRRRIRPGVLALLVISALALGLSGCGSPGTGSAGSAGGTYTVTITGTSGNTSANGSFNLTVQ